LLRAGLCVPQIIEGSIPAAKVLSRHPMYSRPPLSTGL
jgi:hypothetical protein